MGMYDTINGEQVKCFSWVSIDNDEIWCHGGDLKYYGTGEEVPYKRPHYNYGKNFIILDLNKYPDSFICQYDYVIHVIRDGKVVATFNDEIGDIDWSDVSSVVGYYGEPLNIHSSEDMKKYMDAQRKYDSDYENINNHWDELFKESNKYFIGLGCLDNNSEEKKMRREKIKEIQKLMDEEKERIKPEIEKLSKEHSKWFVDTSNIRDLITLGEFISACNTHGCDKEYLLDNIRKMLSSDQTLYDRYVEWQESDEYIKEFKVMMG